MVFLSSKAAVLAHLVALATLVRAQGGASSGGSSSAVAACVTRYPTAINELTTTFASSGAASNDLKCYMSCVLQGKGRMAQNGTMIFNGFPPNVPASKAAAILPCFQLTPTADLCETAYQHGKCLWTNDSDRQFLRFFKGGGKQGRPSSSA